MRNIIIILTLISPILTTSVCTFAGNTTNDSLTVYLQPCDTKPTLNLYGRFKDVAKEAAGAYGTSMSGNSRLLRYDYSDKDEPLTLLLSDEGDGRFSLVADMNFNNDFSDDYKYFVLYKQLPPSQKLFNLEPQPLKFTTDHGNKIFRWFSPSIYIKEDSANLLESINVIPSFNRIYYSNFEYEENTYSILIYEDYFNNSKSIMSYKVIDSKDIKLSETGVPEFPPTMESLSTNMPTAIHGNKVLHVGNTDLSNMTCGITISDIPGEDCDSIPLTGFYAPLFKKKSVEGQTISLNKMRGHYILIDFWGTWCKPCISVIPELRDIHKKYPQLEIISVAVEQSPNIDYGFTPAPLKKAIKELQMDWHNIQDKLTEGPEQISEKYKITAYPTTVLIDTEGKIIYRKSSILAMDSLRKILEESFGY